jgi:type IV secretory pathway VirJ component
MSHFQCVGQYVARLRKYRTHTTSIVALATQGMFAVTILPWLAMCETGSLAVLQALLPMPAG